MRSFFYVLILLTAILVGLEVIHDPGYVLFYFHHWTVEMPFWLCLLAFIIIIYIGHLVWRVVYDLFHRRGIIRSWHQHRNLHKGVSATGQGLLELTKGYPHKAEKLLLQGLKTSKTPLLNYLGAARAAQEYGDFELRDKYLLIAKKKAPKERLAIEITEAHLLIEEKQYQAALEIVHTSQKETPKNKELLSLLLTLYLELQQYKNLKKILPLLKKQQIIKPDEYDKLLSLTSK